MAESLKAIKEQIGTVSNLKKMVRAMEMVARSKLKRAVDAALSARPYTEQMLGLLSELSEDMSEDTHPLLTPGPGENELIVHIASDRGLSGGYSAQAKRGLELFLETRDRTLTHGISIGKNVSRHIEHSGIFHIQNFVTDEHVGFEEVQNITTFIIDRFMSGNYCTIYLSYTNFETIFSQKHVTQQLLPLSLDSFKHLIETAGGTEDVQEKTDLPQFSKDVFSFEPSRSVVLERVLPRLVWTQVYHALLEAFASEQASRMVAMKNATDNAIKIGAELTLKYNRARQATITREIIEIAAGADAV